jgi:hypothetical protein
MTPIRSLRALAVAAALMFATLASPLALAQNATPSAGTGSASVVLEGLTNPRGFTWGADGTIYMALAGHGGTTSATEAGAPFPLLLGTTASVIAITTGCPRTVVDGLPSYLWTDKGWVWGAMDVAILDGKLYVLSGGGELGIDQPIEGNGIFRINDDGTRTMIADLSTWLTAHPPAFVPPDYDPNGSLFDLEAGNGALWASEAVGGRVLKIDLDGTITLFADLSAQHPVPTGIALAPDGGVYVGFETAAPFTDGQSRVVHIAADGTQTDVMTGLTMVTDITTGADGSLYVLEMSTGNGETEPFVRSASGRLLHQLPDGTAETIADHLDFPVDLGLAPSGTLYVTGPAFGADDGEGWLARIDTESAATVTAASPVPDARTCNLAGS